MQRDATKSDKFAPDAASMTYDSYLHTLSFLQKHVGEAYHSPRLSLAINPATYGERHEATPQYSPRR